MSASPVDADAVVAATRRWVERAVIGLNLCPFAKAVQVKQQIRYVVSAATATDALLDDLCAELQHLAEVDPQQTDTTLLIHPGVLHDFLEFNDFLGIAEVALQQLGLEGVLQIADFHPQYRFADSGPDDVENCTNRSPYPTLHLLRESSIDRAVEAFPEAEAIYEANMRTLRRLGHEGWVRLMSQPD
ncbi:DUF1415 domain-containing protein [Caldimonas brevitalea]|nr:DUF1415 domain-containing protein [Caldimonas brevitalea]